MKKEHFIIQKTENTNQKDNINKTLGLNKNRSASIKVIGVGGGGSNALSYMFEQGINGVDFIACNTDSQALQNNPVPLKIQLGASITEGLGAGADPEIGEKAALESLEEIKNILDSNTKMTFITAGMGGGTGTGAAPIIAGISKEKGILTVGIVTIPFHFEGQMRLQQAQKGIESLRNNVDSLIVINNDKLRELYGNLGFKAGFAKADEVLTTAAKGIAEVITHHYKQNIDLRDTRTVLKESGTAIMGSAISIGENRAKEAVIQALDSPLLNDNKITGAKNVLLLIVSGKIEITIDEIGIISDYIQAEAGNKANIIMGLGEDEKLEESISVTIVATGFPTEVQRVINHEEKKIFHKLEDNKKLKKDGIHPYSRIDTEPYKPGYYKQSTSENLDTYSLDNKKESFFNHMNNVTKTMNPHQQKEIKSSKTQKHKKYLLEDHFDLPIDIPIYSNSNEDLNNHNNKNKK
ncbi:cell division protein FtsZ [Blattabacterium cuenoti]|uniref:cell division protein FtsZ n=1 Tax=Blattabacterium cuenoti TaxID=1653831 RepID=UPI001EEC4024|nr:cell division protein FtsZ [Blattabacterium cuenoti]